MPVKKPIVTDQQNIDQFVEYLWIFRTAAGWTAADLSRALGFSESAVSNMEHGRRKVGIVHYLDMRYLFEEEYIQRHNTLLGDLIDILVDSKYTTQKAKDKIAEQVSDILVDFDANAGSLKPYEELQKHWWMIGSKLVRKP